MSGVFSPSPGVPGLATAGQHGQLSAADKAKLDAYPAYGDTGLAAPTAWAAPTLATNWSVFGGLAAGYKRDALGRVHLRGVIAKSIAVVSGETVFTLPAGFRPAQNVNYGSVSNSAFAYISVSTAGVVAVQVGNMAWVSLDPVSFDTA